MKMNKGGKSVMSALLSGDEVKRAKESRKKAERKALKEKLEDYNKYEKEVKKRKGKERSWHDRFIDPKKIAADRKKAKEMGMDMKSLYGDMLE